MTTTQPPRPSAKWGRRILRIAFLVALALTLITCTGGYVLLSVSPVPEIANYEIELSQIRPLALEGNGALPLRLNTMIVAEVPIPRSW